jgi:hypothetical protein
MKKGYSKIGQSKSKKQALKDISESERNYVSEEFKILKGKEVKETIISIDTTIL